MTALQWIKYLAHLERLGIKQARNSGEKIIGPYRVDGYYETERGEKVVLEFHGDFWHGNGHHLLRLRGTSLHCFSFTRSI